MVNASFLATCESSKPTLWSRETSSLSHLPSVEAAGFRRTDDPPHGRTRCTPTVTDRRNCSDTVGIHVAVCETTSPAPVIPKAALSARNLLAANSEAADFSRDSRASELQFLGIFRSQHYGIPQGLRTDYFCGSIASTRSPSCCAVNWFPSMLAASFLR